MTHQTTPPYRTARRGRQRASRFAAVLCALLFLFASIASSVGAVTQAQINALKEQQQQLNTSKANLQQQINGVQNNKAQLVQKKLLLEEQIEVIRQELRVTNDLIAQYDQQIADKQVELQAAEAEEARYYELFCERVRAMEEGGDVSYWAVLFNSNDFSDLIDRLNMVGEIMDHDNRMMDALEVARAAVAEAKAQLETMRADQLTAKQSLEASQSQLTTQQASLDALIDELESKEDEYKDKLDEMAEDAHDLSNELAAAEQKYAAQLAAAAEAARQAAAKQEAARQEAARQEAARQAAQNANKGGNSNSGSSNPDSSNSGSTGGSTSPTTSGSGGYIWPLSGHTRVISKFGPRTHPISGRASFHGGVDIPAPGGTTIAAAKAGVVVISAYNSSYGNYVTLAHPDGTRTLYAHMKSRAASEGQSVSQGSTIGYVGSTGSSTGNHLHFEVWKGSSSSSRVNPMNYF